MLKLFLIIFFRVLQLLKLSPPISCNKLPQLSQESNHGHQTYRSSRERDIYQNFLGWPESCQNIQQLSEQQEEQNECLPPEGYYNCINWKVSGTTWKKTILLGAKFLIKYWMITRRFEAYFFWTRVFFISKQASASFLPWTVIRTISAPLSAILITYQKKIFDKWFATAAF